MGVRTCRDPFYEFNFGFRFHPELPFSQISPRTLPLPPTHTHTYIQTYANIQTQEFVFYERISNHNAGSGGRQLPGKRTVWRTATPVGAPSGTLGPSGTRRMPYHAAVSVFEESADTDHANTVWCLCKWTHIYILYILYIYIRCHLGSTQNQHITRPSNGHRD